MGNIEAAIQFVRNHGNTVENARLNVLLQDDSLVHEAIYELKASQREDGSFAPFWSPDTSSLDATCYRLAQFEQLGLKESALIDKAISFLMSRQGEDGSFEEESTLKAVAPPWAMPGDLSARLYLTANSGYWIRYYKATDPYDTKIKEFLISHMNDKGYLPTFLHANWLAAGFLYSLEEYNSANSIMDHLQSVLPELEASNLAWLINALIVSGVPSQHPLISNARSRLMPLQQADGRWASEDGEWQDVHTTLESLRAMNGHYLG